MKIRLLNLLLTLFVASGAVAASIGVTQIDQKARQTVLQSIRDRVCTQTLENGVTVICYSTPNTNEVTVGGLVGVGFRHEQANEWGIAHILEHMSCKATKKFPEGAIDHLGKTHGLGSGDSNAHTGSDHTYYYYRTDVANWKVFADVVAEIMQNVEIDPAALTSELGAVSQEIKYRFMDQNKLGFADFFPLNHPYSHEGIGYKEEVLTYTAEQVMAFYNKYYTPQRSTFFVFGNVDPADVFSYASRAFAGFNRPETIDSYPTTTLPFYAGFSTVTKTMYHSQLHRMYEYSWISAPQNTIDSAALEYVAYALDRRLKQKCVDKEGWCTRVSAGVYALDYTGAFGVTITPREEFCELNYDAIVAAEIADIAANGVQEDEFIGMYQETLQVLVERVENPSALILDLAFTSMVHNDVFAQYCIHDEYIQQVTQDIIKRVTATYLRPILMGKGVILPLPEEERDAWQALQAATTMHDQALLASRTRTEKLPEVDFSVLPSPAVLPARPLFGFSSFELSNGMTVYFRRETVSPRCAFSLVIRDNEAVSLSLGSNKKAFAKQHWHTLLRHGAGAYSKKDFDELCDRIGVSIFSSESNIGVISLGHQFEQGLKLMRLTLDEPHLPEAILSRKKREAAEKVAKSKNDLFYQFRQYLTKTLYKEWPWKFTEEEELQNTNAVTMDDIRAMVSLVRDPSKVVGVITGNFSAKRAKALAEKYFGSLATPTSLIINALEIPPLVRTASGHVEVSNEQAYVIGVRPTCTLDSSDAAALEILGDYIDGMVWNIRMRTGLFYGGQGFVRQGSQKLPGAIQIAILACPGTLKHLMCEVQDIVASIYEAGVDDATVQSLKRQRLHNRNRYLFTPTTTIGSAADALGIGMPLDYEEQLDERISRVTMTQVNAVIDKYFDPSTWSFITVGCCKEQ